MANKGLKPYTKQITQSLGDLAMMSVNVNKEDANIHISLPLLKTIGLSPIDLSLIYNILDKDINGIFGKGFKLNHYAKLDDSNLNYTITNADGSVDEYLYLNNNENKETQTKITLIDLDDYGYHYYYKLEDKFGNIKEYYPNNMDYPINVITKNGDRFNLFFDESSRSISNNHGDVVKFSSDKLITEINYLYNDILLYIIKLKYDSLDRLINLSHIKEDSIISSVSIEYGDNTIKVIDDISSYYIRYTLNNNKVESYVDGVAGKDKKDITTISYDDNKTTISGISNQRLHVFFDDNQLPIYEMDNDGNIVETEYDSETKAILSKSSPVSIKNIENNIINNLKIKDFENDGVNVETAEVSNAFFSDFLTDVYKVSGTGKLIKTIDVVGVGTDNITLALWGKQLKSYTDSSYVKVNISIDGDNDSHLFKNENLKDIYDLVLLGVNAKKSFSKIIIEIELLDSSIELGGLQLLKKDFGSFYEYDENGNPKTICFSGAQSNANYNNGLMSNSLSKDSTMYSYEYDSKGNLIQAKTAYDVKMINTYDEYNNLTKTLVTSDSKTLETKRKYSDDGRFLTEEIDELGNVTQYQEYDNYGRLLKVMNSLEVTTEYEYTEFDAIKRIFCSKLEESSECNYSYDDKQRIQTVTLNNGTLYEFLYDDFDLLTDVLLNGEVVFHYEYDEKGAVILQKYGKNADAFKFEYNDDGNVSGIYYIDAFGVLKLKYSYKYDNKGRIIECLDENNTILSAFEYDIEGNVISVKDASGNGLDYRYDNLGNVILRKVINEDKVMYYSFDYVSRSKGSHPEAILDVMQKNTSYIGTIFANDDGILKGQFDEQYYFEAKPLFYDGYEASVKFEKDGIIPCAHVNDDNLLSYQVCDPYKMSSENGFVAFWFKPKSMDCTGTIFSSKHPTNVDSIRISIVDNTLEVIVRDENENEHIIITTDSSVKYNEWNFISLNYLNRDDGLGYADVSEYEIMLNGKFYSFRQKNPRLYSCFGYPPVYNIGHNIDGGFISECFNGYITALAIGYGRYVTTDEVIKYYKTTRDYIIDNQYIDSGVKSVDFSNVNLYNSQEDFDIFPLHNNVVSLKETKPIRFDIRNVTSLDRDRTFNFNPLIKRYAYVADGSVLEYDFEMSNVGTIAMKIYVDGTDEKQYLFESYNSSNQNIAVYINSEKKLCVNFNGTILNSNLAITERNWHFVSFSYMRNIVSSSNVSNTIFSIRLKLDNEKYENVLSSNVNFSNMKTIIGRAKESISCGSLFGGYTSCCSLLGQIEMLAVKKAFCEDSTICDLKNNIEVLSKTMEYDELGLLQKWDIHNDGKTILSNKYEYRRRTSYSKYYSKQIRKEVFETPCQTFNRSYAADSLENVTGIIDSNFGDHTYRYDYRGFLIKADSTDYEYDHNGNIKKIDDLEFIYDSTIKDRLISVGNNEIKYEDNNPCNPTSYLNNNYKYEGRRLIQFSNENATYTYGYNAQGLRISKQSSDGKYNKYFYDGDKLIVEHTNEYKNNYLYDENNILYGIIHNNERYFYIRDFMQNILGIVDIEGNLVVKYEYDAYGNILNILGDMAESLGVYNPFRYKGYYYDSESNMYYCKTRYYVPQWCRWLNNDSIKVLELYDINDLNLFCYCQNNPITGIDDNGNFLCNKFWTCFAVGVAAVVAVAVITAVTVTTGGAAAPVIIGAISGGIINGAISVGTQVFQNKGFNNIDWGNVFIDSMAGAVTGALGGSVFGPIGNAVGSGVTDAVSNFANSMYNGDPLSLSLLGECAISGIIGAVLGATKGAQHKNSHLAKIKNNKSRIKNMKKRETLGSIQHKNAVDSVKKNLKALKKEVMKFDKLCMDFPDLVSEALQFSIDVVKSKY